ncbi:MAG: multicopper oxidase domain-containing protein [Nocardiaceae bacterium]|nr:multicopper oxidase domain-containing protein [Nocardiaceae bacterium]
MWALGAAAGAAAAGTVVSSADAVPLPPPGGPIPDIAPVPVSPLGYHSPPLQPYVDKLPIPARRGNSGQLSMVAGPHRFHRDLPPTRVWGYDQAYLGPTLIAQSHVTANLTVTNQLGVHPLAQHVDTTLHGATEEDKTNPRSNIHLHGGVTPASSDGHPYDTVRNGGAITYNYPHRQEAMTLWYHDHAVGITRLNVHAGLAGAYWIRDEFDTGEADNPLGLPSGEYEIPLVVQDKIFRPDGTMVPLLWFFLPTNFNQAGNFGDVACVNGVAWPRLDVKRGIYRFRFVNGSNSRNYQFTLSEDVPMWVIGSDQGLLNAPVKVEDFGSMPGERYDVLIDFRNVPPGTRIVLQNVANNSVGDAAFMIQALPNIMEFVVGPEKGFTGGIPKRLRGGPGLPAAIPGLTKPDRVRSMTMLTLLDEERPQSGAPAMNTLNNLRFHTEDVEMVPSGSVEQWDLINSTLVDHPIHIHLCKFRVIGRQPFNSAAYFGSNPPPAEEGRRWNPSADNYVIGPMEPPEPEEVGWKDTVACPVGFITRILVYFPSRDEMGFDPDAPFAVNEPIPTTGMSMPGMSMPGMSMPMPKTTSGSKQAQGYVWHCHILDHEDHDMMLPMRVM